LYCHYAEFIKSFFGKRNIDDRFARSPQTLYTKKMLDLILKGPVDKNIVFWMWHPKNHKDYFNIKITYESYPDSQEEVNKILTRARLPIRVIYDPEELASRMKAWLGAALLQCARLHVLSRRMAPATFREILSDAPL
jgi:hypothetical protein